MELEAGVVEFAGSQCPRLARCIGSIPVLSGCGFFAVAVRDSSESLAGDPNRLGSWNQIVSRADIEFGSRRGIGTDRAASGAGIVQHPGGLKGSSR